MAHFRLLVICCVAAFVTACSMGGNSKPSPEETGAQPTDLFKGNDPKNETDPEKRVNDMLQQAKSAYDEGTYEAAHRYAETAERLVVEKKVKDRGYRATALNIQAYALLQLGLVDDYRPQSMPGYVRGSLSKFEEAMKLSPDSFRAKLGVALCQFSRHATNVSKSEKLGEGVFCLHEIETTLSMAFDSKDPVKARAHFNRAGDLYALLVRGREKLLELHEVFHDPSSVPLDPKTRTRPEAPRLTRRSMDRNGNAIEFSEEQETMAVADLKWIIDAARDGKELEPDDPRRSLEAASTVRSYWQDVRFYWRKKALQDLQESRDQFLELCDRDMRDKRKSDKMRYFWIDRDLAFVFSSLGAFFLDMAFEDARLKALTEGRPLNEIEARARELIVDPKHSMPHKLDAKKNYESALSYFNRFVQQHEQFERLMITKAEKADFNDVTENPFLVDLQARYRSEMLESVSEERGMRRSIILEECALVIDPLYQNSDLDRALIFAGQLKSLDPKDPIHHFVRATAYYERAARYLIDKENENAVADYKDGRDEYQAYMRASSVTTDSGQRKVARQRIEECDRHIKEMEVIKSAGGE